MHELLRQSIRNLHNKIWAESVFIYMIIWERYLIPPIQQIFEPWLAENDGRAKMFQKEAYIWSKEYPRTPSLTRRLWVKTGISRIQKSPTDSERKKMKHFHTCSYWPGYEACMVIGDPIYIKRCQHCSSHLQSLQN